MGYFGFVLTEWHGEGFAFTFGGQPPIVYPEVLPGHAEGLKYDRS